MILIGDILKLRGNKGEVVCTSSPYYSQLVNQPVVLKSGKYQKNYTIESYREVNGMSLLKFSEVKSMNDAYKLISYSIYSDNHEISESEESEPDVSGYTVTDINSNIWGKADYIEESAMQEILHVDSEEGEILIPFTLGIIADVNHKTRTILIDPPEGLRDLNKK